jgi:hypothetical protein
MRVWAGALLLSQVLVGRSTQAQEIVDPVDVPEGELSPEEPEGYGAPYDEPTAPPRSWALSPRQPYSLKADLQLEVPVPVSDAYNQADPGFGLQALFGWDLGWLVPTANFGWSWSSLNLPAGASDDRGLRRFHLGLGVMAEFENRSVVTPVVGAMVDFNWWHVSGDYAVVCNDYYYWGCYSVDAYDYTTGFSLRGGIDLRVLPKERFTLGTGVMPSVTLSGGPFRGSQWWVSPYLVLTIRR